MHRQPEPGDGIAAAAARRRAADIPARPPGSLCADTSRRPRGPTANVPRPTRRSGSDIQSGSSPADASDRPPRDVPRLPPVARSSTRSWPTLSSAAKRLRKGGLSGSVLSVPHALPRSCLLTGFDLADRLALLLVVQTRRANGRHLGAHTRAESGRVASCFPCLASLVYAGHRCVLATKAGAGRSLDRRRDGALDFDTV
jgi:hypothetical protein